MHDRTKGSDVYLVDTSVWIEVFRKPARIVLEDVTSLDEIVTCLPVIQEVLQGFRDQNAFQRAKNAMLAFPIVESPLSKEVYLHSVDLFRSARHAGFSVRSSVDCVIAACAIRNDLLILHRDRDYHHLSRISPLQTIEV